MVLKFKDLEICKNYQSKDKAKILTCLDLLLNKQSELNKIQNIDERRAEACRQSGVKSAAIFNDLQVQDLIFHYLSYFQHSNEFHLLYNDQVLYWDLMKQMMKPVESGSEDDGYDQKLKISEKAGALLQRIELRFARLFNADEIGSDIVDMVETKIRMLRPEERVTKKSADV
jgi:hypothetical protein